MQKMLMTILAAIGMLALGPRMLALGPQTALAWPASGCPAGEYGLIASGQPVPNACFKKCHKNYHVEGGYCVKTVSTPPPPASQSSGQAGAAKCHGGPAPYKKQTHANTNAPKGPYNSAAQPQKC